MLDSLKKTIKLIDIANRIDKDVKESNAKEILKVMGEYSKALDLFDGYDHSNLKKIDNNTLVALTLLIAESNPKEKSIMIDINNELAK